MKQPRERDMTFVLLSRALLPELEGVGRRMGWTLPWVSSYGSDVDDDLGITVDSRETFGLGVSSATTTGTPFRTFTSGRGVEALGSVWTFVDLTPLGRHETWERTPRRPSPERAVRPVAPARRLRQGARMSTPYTHKKLTDVEDSAPKFGYEGKLEARFAREDLGAEDTGVSFHRIMAGQRQPFAHRHEQAEEVYVVVAGSGRAKLDDAIIDIAALDAIRVAPGVIRAFEAGSEDLQLLVCGPHHAGDGELIEGWWSD